MLRKFFIRALFIFFLAFSGNVLALTDPEPNPFTDLSEGEKVFEATVVEASDEVLSVVNSDEENFSSRMEAIFKYRDGAGPAAAAEFFAGDTVRILVNSAGVIIAAQNADLLLCDQNFYGWVREPTENSFTLETVDGKNFEVLIGKTTQFRDENSKILFGYSSRADDVVRIHGVINQNVGKIFTETFGAYVSLLAEDALQPFLDKIAKQKEEERARIEAELGKQKFSDVDIENPFFYAINFVANEKIAAGYAAGDFQPGKEINRAEFTKILVKTKFSDELETFEMPTESCFPDFEIDAWFASFVCFAKEKGILGGYPDGKFKPANPVNLAEAVTILVKSFEFSVEDNSNNEWFAPFLEKASKLEILPADFAEANENLTRGKMSELVMRAIKYERGELVDYLENNS
ncbi:S-layer homology domain-containing protein [Candidatus Gracilibacteria bacterium]|nr:S-layer homology domain-containing protein [Candidatus Gracilibacteria bacterium]MCF7856130.1 S-layer homology domain-containing protein [Candidatus Gracilibacteria bacterium]MCF7896549.1 S-layer homology domain-containing protein [Candidatus Gracilibacteria bacterium]